MEGAEELTLPVLTSDRDGTSNGTTIDSGLTLTLLSFEGTCACWERERFGFFLSPPGCRG